MRYSANHTRPDLLAAIGIISSGMSNPSDNDIAAITHIKQYLLSTPDLSLTLGGDPHVCLIGFSDVSYVTKGESKSRLAYCLFLNLTSGCVIAKSWKDSTISHSSTEAEIKAIDALIREIIWMRGFLAELGFAQEKPTTIYVDNESSIAITTSMNNMSTKVSHMIMRINFIQQEILAGTVELKSIRSENELADILTKPLLFQPLEQIRNYLLNGFNGMPKTSL